MLPCENCPQKKSPNVCALPGRGNKERGIFIIGCNPGREEKKEGEIFVGPSGEILNGLLRVLSLSEASFITNAVACWTEIGGVSQKHIDSCRGRILKELEEVKPKVIILLGGVAVKSLFPENTQSIAKLRLRPMSFNGIPVIVTYHPSFLLRGGGVYSPSYVKFKGDLQRAENFLKGKVGAVRTPINYRIVTQKEDICLLFEVLSKYPNVAVDFETNTKQSKNIFFRDARPLTVSFSCREGESFCIPLYHPQSPLLKDIDWVMGTLTNYLKDMPLTAHFSTFENMVFHKWFSPEINCKDDSLLISYLFNEHIPHDLHSLILNYTDIEGHKEGYYQYEGEENDKVPLPVLADANLCDTDASLRIFNKLNAELSKEEKEFYSTYMMGKFVPLCVKMIENGIKIDTEYVRQLIPKSILGEQVLKNSWGEIVGGEISSTQQLSHFLLQCGFILPHTEKEGHSTEKKMLKEMQVSGYKKTIIEYLLQYKDLSYVNRYYLAKLFNYLTEDGIIHSNFKVHGSKSGRLSSSEINLQNISKNKIVQRMFCTPGFFVTFDYSSHELRYFAMLMRDKSLMNLFKEGFDPHLQNAALIYDKNLGAVTQEERFVAKSLGFGVLYGSGANTQSRALNISKDKAKELIGIFKGTYPCISGYYKQVEEEYLQKGYLTTSWGRRFKRPPLSELSFSQRVNYGIQGPANFVVLVAGFDLIKKGYRVMQQVHDSLTVEFPSLPTKEEILDVYNTCVRVVVPGYEDITGLWDGTISIGRNLGDMVEL